MRLRSRTRLSTGVQGGPDRSQEEQRDQRGVRHVLVGILLLLIALLCVCPLADLNRVERIRRNVIARTEFIVRNIDCVKCHTEDLVAIGVSTHEPYLKHHCTSCHTPHKQPTSASTTTRTEVIQKTSDVRSWLRWGPLRRPVQWVLGRWSTFRGEPKAARLRVLKARVTVRRPAATRWETVEGALALTPHTSVMTDGSGRADITLFEDSVVRLDRRTHVRLSESQQLSGGRGGNRIGLTQSLGRTWHRVKALLGPQSEYEIKTPTAVAAVRGTEFGVEVASDGTTTFVCVDGTVQVNPNQGETVDVPAGSQLEVTPDEPVSLADLKEIDVQTESDWLVFNVGAEAASESQQESASQSEGTPTLPEGYELGPSTLVAPVKVLCWSCHGSLQPERDMSYPHQPFARNNCISCHEPHKSDNPVLLTAPFEVLCVMCHPIEGLQRENKHQPAARFQCMDCHKPHASEYEGILVMRQRDLCFTCHVEEAQLSAMSVQHQPFEEDNCTGCHEPHGSDYDPLLTAESPDLCYRCHEAIEPRFERTSAHPVGTQIDCSSCHSPHASAQKGLLVLAERDLCLNCHTEVSALTAMSVQHAPFSDSPCTSCHTPHGSDFAPLLRNPEPNLCYRCHPTIAVAMSRTSHHPEECSRCHLVHASDYQGLLVAGPGNTLCYRCHAEIAFSYLDSEHRSVDCVTCHNPHGSRFGALRATSPMTLCADCHPGDSHARFVGKNTHRVTPRFYDVSAADPLTCTSSCHNPHGTDYGYMIRGTEGYYDGFCRGCHGGVGKRF